MSADRPYFSRSREVPGPGPEGPGQVRVVRPQGPLAGLQGLLVEILRLGVAPLLLVGERQVAEGGVRPGAVTGR